MLAIVGIKGNKIIKKIHHANLLKIKYDLEVKDLVERALVCQTKYGPYGNNTSVKLEENIL